ncbi:hypothetical protein HDU76_001574 [Blyttiomyces sp. JEL0837]|nr:hypothetical protein HDU76_001574 [Blyttiomyces sp. JEL0837]
MFMTTMMATCGRTRILTTGSRFQFRSLATAPTPSKPPTPPSRLTIWTLLFPITIAGGSYLYTTQIHQPKNEELIKKRKAKERPVAALDGESFREFQLKDVVPITHNTSRFRFALPEGTAELGLPTASCVVTKFVRGVKPDGKLDVVIRPYTPVEDPAEGYTGYFDLIIKKYPDGPMSNHIFSLKKGDTLNIKGPIAKYPYVSNKDAHIGMIAGGTGITPMLQVIQRVFSNPSDKTKLTLIFANVTKEDIILKEYWDSLEKEHKGQFEVFYTLDKPTDDWKQGKGFVNEDMINKFMPKPGQGKVFICGPNPMLAHVSGLKAKDYTQGEIGGLLKKLGYTSEDIYKF